jgi:hypothetical protein
VVRLVGAFVILVAALGACSEPGPDDYDEAVEREFLESCVTGSDVDVCRCLYDRIEDEIPFERFEEIDRQLAEDPAELPDDVSRLAVVCATEALSGES